MEETVETNSGNYERERVPEKDRKRWLSISMVWIAIGIDLSGMFMGVALSQGMAFWTAIYAVIIGSSLQSIHKLHPDCHSLTHRQIRDELTDD